MLRNRSLDIKVGPGEGRREEGGEEKRGRDAKKAWCDVSKKVAKNSRHV